MPGNWINIHGTLGVILWPLALLFGLYSLSIGRARLNPLLPVKMTPFYLNHLGA